MQSHTKTVLVLGLLVAAMPYLGIPENWKTGLYVVCGVLIALITFVVDRQLPRKVGVDMTATAPLDETQTTSDIQTML